MCSWEITGVRNYNVRCSKYTDSIHSSGSNRDYYIIFDFHPQNEFRGHCHCANNGFHIKSMRKCHHLCYSVTHKKGQFYFFRLQCLISCQWNTYSFVLSRSFFTMVQDHRRAKGYSLSRIHDYIHTHTFGRNPLNECSAWSKCRYLINHNTHKRVK